MGLFDQVAGALGAGQAAPADGLLETVLHLVNNPETGGLPGLVKSFQEGGLGEAVNSWVSSGPNLPVSAEQIQAVLGSEMVQNLAAKLGVSGDQAAGNLAGLLPKVIDQLTPDGQLPQAGGLLSQGLDLLKKGGLFS